MAGIRQAYDGHAYLAWLEYDVQSKAQAEWGWLESR